MPSDNKEKCYQIVHSYQRRFPAVPSLSWSDWEALNNPKILVDARTRAEQQVSMIPGAVPLQDLKLDGNVQIVGVYCTIGYRSGLEATRLQDVHPQLQVYNLDGIVAYTHHRQADLTSVHVFAGPWDLAACAHTKRFGMPAVLGRLAQVGVRVVVRKLQRVVVLVRACCRRENAVSKQD